MQAQNYRLAFWRAAARGPRLPALLRCHLVSPALRIEDEHVFSETHELVLGWLRDGTLDGLRIDHPDGLRDPKSYFDRLHAASPSAWIVAEKILEPGEQLPSDWPIAGTTGYDFVNHVERLFVDQSAEAAMSELYADFTGLDQPFGEVAYEAKQQVLREVLASELNRLTEYLLGGGARPPPPPRLMPAASCAMRCAS